MYVLFHELAKHLETFMNVSYQKKNMSYVEIPQDIIPNDVKIYKISENHIEQMMESIPSEEIPTETFQESSLCLKRSDSNLIMSENRKKRKKNFSCDICQANFNNFISLSCHFSNDHKIKPHECQFCFTQTFGNEGNLIQHINTSDFY